MTAIKTNLFILVIVALALTSCESLEPNLNPYQPEESVNFHINGLMEQWYYWSEDMSTVDYLSYDNPYKLLEDLKVPQDKWSFMDIAENNYRYFEEGEEFGFGFHLNWDSNRNLRVIIVYTNTNAYSEGIRRGWVLEEIGGIDVHQISDFSNFDNYQPGSMIFTFLDPEKVSHTIKLSKQEYTLNAVFNASIIEIESKKIGYFNYQSFLGYSKQELTDTLTYLKSESIDELIVDLRYNSGGYNSIAQQVSEAIVPPGNEGNILYSMLHNNNKKAQEDTAILITSNAQNLNLNRVFFITNKYSASASELVINCLKPYMDVLQIGDTTSGKPYAMKGSLFKGWVIYPVIAKTVNADENGEYANGIIPDIYIADNHNYNWGDKSDPAIQQAIKYIQNGSFKESEVKLKGLQIQTFETPAIPLPHTNGLSIIDK